MGTAGLKIKFIPVMKDFCKDRSQCCLEIVPEISAIQNLDQIEWKEENNLIEYTIPMTYKIILKKLPRQTINEIKDSLNKMYYSCVDLLIPSSMTKFNLASGDVSQIISDTYVVHKLSDNLNNTEDTQKLLLNQNRQKENQEPANNQNSTDEHLFKEQITNSMSNKDETCEDIESHKNFKVSASGDPSRLNTVNINRKSIDKITNTESDFALCTDASTQSSETITCISTIMNSTSKGNSNRRLSQTPICYVDADIIKESTTPNSIICYMNQLDKETACIANTCTINNICNENYNKYKLFTKQINVDLNDTGTYNLNFNRRQRILPEVRVAELVQIMEKEIMPLKIMLNELLCKCAIIFHTVPKRKVWKKPSQISLMYKTINSNFNDPMVQCCKKHIKSNRVVYTIVFEG